MVSKRSMQGTVEFDSSAPCVYQLDAKVIAYTSVVGDWCLCANMGSNLDFAHAIQSGI